MPSFISKNGIWEPAPERVATVDSDGNPQIYSGPDREAVKFIEAEGGVVGQDASKDPQLIQASRNAGFNTVEEYLKTFAPTPQQVKIKEEADVKVVTHQPEKPKPGVRPSKGGFNEDNETPEEALAKKK